MFLSSLYGQYAVFTYGFLRLDEPWPYGHVPGLPPYGNTAEYTEIHELHEEVVEHSGHSGYGSSYHK
jgi:hypothetical protein